MNGDRDILLIERIGKHIVQATLNRPPANALNSRLIAKLRSTVQELSREPRPPTLVLTGEGQRFFSAGGDIREVVSATLDMAIPRMKVFHALLCEMEQYPAAIVCAVRGYAVGGGLELLLYSDYVVASSDAQVGFPEINHGLLPAAMGMRQAVALMGRKAAQSLLYSGALVGAERACGLGIIDEIVAPEDAVGRAVTVAQEMCSKDPQLFAAIKRSIGLTQLMTNDDLEDMTLSDMRAYLDRAETADAREKFLRRNKAGS